MQSLKQLIFGFSILTIIFSCNGTIKQTKVNFQTDKVQNIDSSKYINIVSLTPYLDTTDYSKFTISYIGKPDSFNADIPTYYIDTFSQSNCKFRIIHKIADTDNDATLEKLINGQWYRRIEFYKFNGSGEVTHSTDVNNDGYKDILHGARFSSEIYLFDSSTNNFIDTICGELNYDVFLIDSSHNIYCDFQEYRQGCYDIFSTLYTYKNYTKYYLYKLDLYNCDDEEHSKVTKLILSKCLDGHLEDLKEIKTYKLSKPLNVDKDNYFDNKKYWSKEYKRLLGYS